MAICLNDRKERYFSLLYLVDDRFCLAENSRSTASQNRSMTKDTSYMILNKRPSRKVKRDRLSEATITVPTMW
jgi:hypothetical protein